MRNLVDLGRIQRPSAREGAGELLYVGAGCEELLGPLNEAAYRVETAPGEAAALALLEQAQRELVVIDGPTGESIGLYHNLKAHPKGTHIPTLLVLASGDAIKGWEADADEVIERPVDRYELLARVRNLLRKHRKLAELHRSHDLLARRSLTDALTGIYNRAFLTDSLDRETARYRRHAEPFSLLMLDVDHFKRVNDYFGHPKGDEVLRACAQLLKHHVRLGDVVARYGGEEFAVVLPAADEAAALEVAERLRQAVAQKDWDTLGLEQGPTLSIGVACCPGHGADAAALLRAADDALYKAKHQGRNKVELAQVQAPQVTAKRQAPLTEK